MIDHYDVKIRLNVKKSCLEQSNKLTYSYGNKVNVYVVYELGASGPKDDHATITNC